MFADEELETVSVESRWRSNQQAARQTRCCQTQPVLRAEAEVQTGSRTGAASQTEPENQASEQHRVAPEEADPAGLKVFLQRVEATVVRELLHNSSSHAFHGFHVTWTDPGRQVSCVHRLHHPGGLDRSLQVTRVSWSCTGAVLACAYGRMDEGDWCTEPSYVCTWNLLSPKMKPGQADVVVEVPAAVTALSCHPRRPGLLAGGLYSGRVLVWDTGLPDDPVVAQTGISADGHREPVYEVLWVPLQKKTDFGVLSACSGGKVLLWLLATDQRALVLKATYALEPQVPQSLKTRGPLGLTSLAVSSWDPDAFLVGSEGGLLLRCSFSSGRPSLAPPDGHSLAPVAPAVFSFRPGSGPVHSIHPSPFHRNLFVSAGTDGLAHLGSLQHSEPLLSLKVSDSYVFQVQWSPSRPLVLAAATAQGEVQVFDLGHRSLRPVATLEQGGGDVAATSLAFNSQNPQLLAVGRSSGTVDVWCLSSDLTEQRPGELHQLELIANQVAG